MPVKFKAVKPENIMVNEVEMRKPSHYKPRVLRWSWVKPEDERNPSKMIDAKKSFNFWSYS